MPWIHDVLVVAAMLGSGLVAGLCFSFGSFLLRSFERLGARDAIRAMQAINAGILRSTAMVVWFGTAVLGVVVAILAEGATIAVVAAGLYGVAAILVTGFGNVPLNEALDRVDPEAADATAAWARYRTRWSRWNTLRTVLCCVASVSFAWLL